MINFYIYLRIWEEWTGPINVYKERTFDARPDRIDLRDREYQPPLISLPEQYPPAEFIQSYFPDYAKQSELILDQGLEGACTGFGLAAVINYLNWKKTITAFELGELNANLIHG